MNSIDTLNQSPYAFYYLNIDQYLDIDFTPLNNLVPIYAFNNPQVNNLKNKNRDYFCLEENGQKIEIKNSAYLLKQDLVINFIKSHSQSKKLKPIIIPFKASAKIEKICQENDWIYAAVPSSLNRQLEDKINFNKICKENNLPVIPGAIDKLNQENFEKYQKQLTSKLIIQGRFSWAGKKTFIAEKWSEIKDKIEERTTVKYSSYLPAYSLTNNCVITKKGLIQSPPALQYNNILSLSSNPFSTVGRQWPAFIPDNVKEEIKKITESFSKLITSLNYKGFFGLDFLVNENQIFLIECNPRLTASTDIYTQAEFKNNINPLFLHHLLTFLDLDFDINLEEENKRFYNDQIIASEITKKDSQGNTIKRYRDFIPFTKTYYPIEINPQIIEKINEQK